MIVVANGVPDRMVRRLQRTPARVISFSHLLGHDVGRAVGAQAATGGALLFLDADVACTRAEIRPFLTALRAGADIALNAYPTPTQPTYDHPTAVAKRALNLALDRPDLGAASMTAVPHAVRRSALRVVDARFLAIPPLFQARAVLAGLRVMAVQEVNVRLRNPVRKPGTYPYSVRDLIVGDHLEAVHYVLAQQGPRGPYPDTVRDRGEIRHPDRPVVKSHGDSVGTGAVVPACNEAPSIASALATLRDAEIDPVWVVDNGSTDATGQLARASGAAVQTYPQRLGHDVGRVLGAVEAAKTARNLLFVDADFSLPGEQLLPFREAVETGGVDMALNDLSRGLSPRRQRDPVSTMKRFLNLALRRPDLGIASPTAVPHALSHRALTTLPRRALCVPPVALVQAVLAGLVVQPTAFVDVVGPNRRHALHRHGGEDSPTALSAMARFIVGDHLEALDVLFRERGPRAGFVQPRDLAAVDLPSAIPDTPRPVGEGVG